MNKKTHKWFVSLSVLFVLALVVAMLPQPALAGGMGGDLCQGDGVAKQYILFERYVRDTFKANHTILPRGPRGIGSTVVMKQPLDKEHIHLTIWVILAYQPATGEYEATYTVRELNVITACATIN